MVSIFFPNVEMELVDWYNGLNTAIGDETRQNILIALLEGTCEGMRVGEITTKTHLSRPAVSHHLKILCDAKILSVRHEGTKNYYFFNPDESQMKKMAQLFGRIAELIELYSDHKDAK
jgi:DNA-binding transcriptional ArsR family regulator